MQVKAKRTVHFVYATPYSLLDKFSMRLLKKKLRHPEWNEYRWPSPLKAPFSITYHIAESLSGQFRIRLYDLKERVGIAPDAGDILLGHVWTDPKSATRRALDDARFARRYIIGPYNHDPQQVGWMRAAIEKCDAFFAICGTFWQETFDRSPFRELGHKIMTTHMAIDVRDYPLVKKRFSPPGRRKFLYIGRHGRYGDEKGVRLLERLAERIPGFEGGYICEGGDIRGWKKISEPRKLCAEFMARIAEEYDCFINMSRADAQATTVLEAMSWGFPVACTRETGYVDEGLFLLDLENELGNIETLHKIQELSEGDLREIALGNRHLVETRYSWERVLEPILREVK